MSWDGDIIECNELIDDIRTIRIFFSSNILHYFDIECACNNGISIIVFDVSKESHCHTRDSAGALSSHVSFDTTKGVVVETVGGRRINNRARFLRS